LIDVSADGLGTVSVRNDSSSWLHLIIDVNGFFQ
jgi:hypothetical protein